MLPRASLSAVAAILMLVTVGCTKEQAAPARTAPRTEPVASIAGTTQAVLQKTFNVKTSASFSFQIPAHAIQPHLRGTFQSFVGELHGTSDSTANIDFMILTSEQSDSAGSGGADALFSLEASHDQAVNFDLPPSYNQPVTYYLVFRNSDGSKVSKVVDASFRVDF